MEGWVDLGNAPAGSRTRDLSITSPTPYHYTTKPPMLTMTAWWLSVYTGYNDLIIWQLDAT